MQTRCRRKGGSPRRCAPMRGGCSRCWSFSAFPPSSFIPPGPRSVRPHHGICAYWFNGNGADYLSPFYSPEIFGISPHAIFGTAPGWWPSWLRQIFASLPDFVGAGRFPVHLLLLPRRLLQGVLGRPDQLRRRRTAQNVISANAIFRSSSRMSTAICFISQPCSL